MKKALSAALVFAAIGALAISPVDIAPDGVFDKGDVVLFIGDSITHGGRMGDMNHYLGHGYQAEIASRYIGYRPEMNLCFFNRGISGDNTVKLLARWEKDVLGLCANENGWAAVFPERTRRGQPPPNPCKVGLWRGLSPRCLSQRCRGLAADMALISSDLLV